MSGAGVGARGPGGGPRLRKARSLLHQRNRPSARNDDQLPSPVAKQGARGAEAKPLALDRCADYSDAAVIAEIRRVAALLPAPPYRAAFFLAHGGYKFSHLYRRFGGWTQALERAGLAHLAAPARRWTWRERRRGWTIDDAALLAELKRIADLNGDGTIRERDLRRHGHHAPQLYARRFGSWHEAARQIALTPVWTWRHHGDAECTANLRRVWTHLGRAPRAHEMNRPPSTVRAQVYQRRWGSWIKALHAFADAVNATPDDPLRRSLDARALPPAPPVPREERHAVSVALRHAIQTRDRFRCVLCGASPATDPRVTLQIAHIVPFSQGGRSVAGNLRTLCAACNLGRGPHAYQRGKGAREGFA